MLIWLNGAFGAGKTTIARALSSALTDARVVNPEPVGTMVRRCLPRDLRPVDYQDDELFRRGVVDVLATAVGRWPGTVIAAHTLYNPQWFDEIMGGLVARGVPPLHFTLSVSLETLNRRISRGRFWPLPPTPARWRRDHAAECVRALAHERFAIHIDADGDVDEIVQAIVSRLPVTSR